MAPHRVARPGRTLLAEARRLEVEDVLLRKWSLPVAAALRGWTLGFAELRAMLPGVTPRALTMALKRMAGAGLVERTVEGGFPPRTSYRLTGRGEAFLPALAKLERLG